MPEFQVRQIGVSGTGVVSLWCIGGRCADTGVQDRHDPNARMSRIWRTRLSPLLAPIASAT